MNDVDATDYYFVYDKKKMDEYRNETNTSHQMRTRGYYSGVPYRIQTTGMTYPNISNTTRFGVVFVSPFVYKRVDGTETKEPILEYHWMPYSKIGLVDELMFLNVKMYKDFV